MIDNVDKLANYLNKEASRYQAEINTLRAEVEAAETYSKALSPTIEALRAENERLKISIHVQDKEHASEGAYLRGENMRLREALERIADEDNFIACHEVARAALQSYPSAIEDHVMRNAPPLQSKGEREPHICMECGSGATEWQEWYDRAHPNEGE